MSALGEFGSSAHKLSRNPLGIIALFIVLLYGIAGLVLSTTAGNFGPSERWPLIWFLVLFPVLVLGVFAWLVSNHHQKLYGPSDFKTDDAFLRTLSPEVQRRRLDAEVAEVEGELEYKSAPTAPSTQSSESGSSDSTLRPTVQTGRERFRADVVLAEDLVLRQLEAEYGAPIRRQAALRVGDREIHLDGVLVSDPAGRSLAIEVKLFRESTIKKSLHNRVYEIAAKAKELETGSDIPLLVAIVDADLSPESRSRASRELTHIATGLKRPIAVRFFDFTDLRERFGVTGSD